MSLDRWRYQYFTLKAHTQHMLWMSNLWRNLLNVKLIRLDYGLATAWPKILYLSNENVHNRTLVYRSLASKIKTLKIGSEQLCTECF